MIYENQRGHSLGKSDWTRAHVEWLVQVPSHSLCDTLLFAKARDIFDFRVVWKVRYFQAHRVSPQLLNRSNLGKCIRLAYHRTGHLRIDLRGHEHASRLWVLVAHIIFLVERLRVLLAPSPNHFLDLHLADQAPVVPRYVVAELHLQPSVIFVIKLRV